MKKIITFLKYNINKIIKISSLGFFYLVFTPFFCVQYLDRKLGNSFIEEIIRVSSYSIFFLFFVSVLYFRFQYLFKCYNNSNKLFDYYYIDYKKDYHNRLKEFQNAIISAILMTISIPILFFFDSNDYIAQFPIFILIIYLLGSFCVHLKKTHNIFEIIFGYFLEWGLKISIITQSISLILSIQERAKYWLFPTGLYRINDKKLLNILHDLWGLLIFTFLSCCLLLIYILIFQSTLNLKQYLNYLNIASSIIVIFNFLNLGVSMLSHNHFISGQVSIYIAFISFPIISTILIAKLILEHVSKKVEEKAMKYFLKVQNCIYEDNMVTEYEDDILLNIKKSCFYGGDSYRILFYNNQKTYDIIRKLEYKKDNTSF
ncbi:hypothetical protein [Bacillus sp. NSP9.1]|uniref:hypothetical protein n=1 Tax=Bacillus sp. NSP9.1 TaxID=1071078 RepID=UPI00041C44F9|nr:hypothetical protein [Bacillus sp. NSP9.1]QHZ45032.1 hypothetical protein M654_001330 [Bacillus sp. NSP9.1]